MLIKMLIKNACKSDRVLKLIKRCFFQSTLPVLYISESFIEINIKFLFSHFFMVPQKVLWRPLMPS